MSLSSLFYSSFKLLAISEIMRKWDSWQGLLERESSLSSGGKTGCHRGNITVTPARQGKWEKGTGCGRKWAQSTGIFPGASTCCLATAFQPPQVLIFLYCRRFLSVPQPFQLCPCLAWSWELFGGGGNHASGCAFWMQTHTNARYLELAEVKEPLACSLENNIH